jgi:PAS domain S-box-containing protein
MVQLLTGISEANHALLSYKDSSIALQMSITELGKNTKIDRCYIFRNEFENGLLKFYYDYEWCNIGVTPYIGSPDLNGLTYDSFPGLLDKLLSKKAFYGLVAESSDPLFREIMEMQGIKAYLFTPIFLNEKFWGWIGFDDCTNERIWKDIEAKAIQSVANNIGLRLEQEINNINLKNAINELELYIKSSKQAKWEWDIIENKVAFSFNWFGMLGYTEHELEQSYDTWRNNVHSEDVDEVENKLKLFIKGKTDFFEGVFRMIHKNKSIVWIKYSALAIKDKNKNTIRLVGTHIDITDLKNKEMELQISEDKFRFIAENTTDLICQHNAEGVFTYVSNSSTEIIGYSPEELLGKNPFNFLNPINVAEAQNRLSEILSTKKVNTSIFQFLKKNNEYCWLEMTSTLIEDQNNNLIAIQTSSRDITERINAEKEMEYALQKERELNELKSNFVTMASHQFRTPLTVIYSNIELLNYKVEPVSKEIKKDVAVISNRILSEIDRITELMNNILVFGKYESGNINLKISKFNLTYFIEKLVETYFDNEMDQRKLKFEINGKPKLIKSDEGIMTHILSNLISNALKYSPNQQSPIIKLNYLKSCYLIEIIDFGIGIPEEERKYLFQSFFRASNTTSIKGSGLGLNIVKQFTELLNGTITIKNNTTKGTIASLTFPYEN